MNNILFCESHGKITFVFQKDSLLENVLLGLFLQLYQQIYRKNWLKCELVLYLQDIFNLSHDAGRYIRRTFLKLRLHLYNIENVNSN